MSMARYGAAWTASVCTRMPLWRRTSCDLGDRLDRADFVVGEHHADQDRLGRNRRLDFVRVDAAVAIHRHLDDLEAELLEVPDRVTDGVVLDGGGDDPMAASLACPGGALESQVVGLGAAGGEDDLARLGSDGTCRSLVSLVEPGAGPTTGSVQRRGIAELPCQERQHGFEGLGPQRRGGGVVQIDRHLVDCTPEPPAGLVGPQGTGLLPAGARYSAFRPARQPQRAVRVSWARRSSSAAPTAAPAHERTATPQSDWRP
jgi:hypothetical protein